MHGHVRQRPDELEKTTVSPLKSVKYFLAAARPQVILFFRSTNYKSRPGRISRLSPECSHYDLAQIPQRVLPTIPIAKPVDIPRTGRGATNVSPARTPWRQFVCTFIVEMRTHRRSAVGGGRKTLAAHLLFRVVSCEPGHAAPAPSRRRARNGWREPANGARPKRGSSHFFLQRRRWKMASRATVALPQSQAGGEASVIRRLQREGNFMHGTLARLAPPLRPLRTARNVFLAKNATTEKPPAINMPSTRATILPTEHSPTKSTNPPVVRFHNEREA